MIPACRRQGVAAAAIALVLAMTSCAKPADEATAEETAAPPSPTASSPTNDEAPEAVLDRVKADLAGREGVPVGSIEVVTTRGVVWKDASMGCGEPGKSYPLIRIEGYLIILRQGGRQFEYRARPDGPFVLCRQDAAQRVE